MKPKMVDQMLEHKTATIVTLVLVLVTYWVWWRYRRFSLLRRCGIPGPKSSFWFGNFGHLLTGNVPMIGQWMKEHGKVIGFIEGIPTVAIADADLVRLIQVKVSREMVHGTRLIICLLTIICRISMSSRPVVACSKAHLMAKMLTCPSSRLT